jgi:prepilin-type N-terminal cleavage/methylation domain-containing protein
MKLPRLFHRPALAFTLIELLTVISIIALLAALIMWGTTLAGVKKVHNRVNTEMNGIQLAIDGFYKQFGFYPASNPDATMTDLNPLFYELTSSVHDGAAKNFTDIFGVTVSSADIKAKFGVDGFVNSKDAQSTDKSQAQNFMTGLRPDGYATMPSDPRFKMLVVPYKGPGGNFNPWHYNSTSPTNNPDSYDLWAEVVVAGKTNIIGNWKD